MAIDPTYAYTYFTGEQLISSHDSSELTAGLVWTPKRPSVEATTTNGASVAVQYTKGIKGVLASDVAFDKIETRFTYLFRDARQNRTRLLLKTGLAFGELPLQQVYHLSPNNPANEDFWRRFSVAGRDSFETMFFNEFFSDRYLSIQARHTFASVLFFKGFSPSISLVTRFAIGDLEDPQLHTGLPFNTLEMGYYESGLELNRILQGSVKSKFLKGFGLSFMYRYGPYHLPDISDNISFKFTYYFNIRNL